MRFFLEGILLLSLLTGCSRFPAGAERQVKLIAENPRAFYLSGRGTMAEFLTNQIPSLTRECAALRGEPEIDRQEAAGRIARFYDLARLGFTSAFPEAATLPELKQRPLLDGVLSPGEYEPAITFYGEYPLNGTEGLESERNSVWHLGVYDDSLWCAASFEDLEIHSVLPERDGAPIYTGDSLEFFLRPNLDAVFYFEFIIGPEGQFFGRLHGNNPYGTHVVLAEVAPPEIAVRREEGKLTYEFAFPLRELVFPACIRRKRNEFSFMMVRTNRNGGSWLKSTPVPFLYDGHNIFGYLPVVRPKRQP